MGKFGKTGGNAEHGTWGSKSAYLINLHGKVGRSNVFFKAFPPRGGRKIRDSFCTDCLKSCFKKRSYTCKLPGNHQSLPSYQTMKEILSEFESSQSELSQSTDNASQEEHYSSTIMTSPNKETVSQEGPIFEKAFIGDKTYYLVPENLAKYVPNSKVHLQYFPGLGPVEVANNLMRCDLPNCTKESRCFKIMHGCGHSYHTECLGDGNENKCLLCTAEIESAIKSLSNAAATSIFNVGDKKVPKESADDNGCEDKNSTESFNGFTTIKESCLQLQQKICSWGLIPGP
eukprot:gene11848-2390_t